MALRTPVVVQPKPTREMPFTETMKDLGIYPARAAGYRLPITPARLIF